MLVFVYQIYNVVVPDLFRVVVNVMLSLSLSSLIRDNLLCSLTASGSKRRGGL